MADLQYLEVGIKEEPLSPTSHTHFEDDEESLCNVVEVKIENSEANVPPSGSGLECYDQELLENSKKVDSGISTTVKTEKHMIFVDLTQKQNPIKEGLGSLTPRKVKHPRRVRFGQSFKSITVKKSPRPKDKRYGCEHCGKAFTAPSKLKCHLATHTGDRPFSCEECGKSFIGFSKLKRHLRTHTGEKPYSCLQCEKSFSLTNNLTAHLRIHSGEKPYMCEQCGKSYTDRSKLKRHSRTHSGEKPFSCKQCGKSFSVNDTLTRHLRTHTGERPYSCEQCGKSFSVNNHLIAHLRTHTGERPFPCELCGKTFAQHWNMKSHLRIHAKHKNSSSVVNYNNQSP